MSKSLFRKLFRPGHPHVRAPHRPRPAMELLEDRLLPSAAPLSLPPHWTIDQFEYALPAIVPGANQYHVGSLLVVSDRTWQADGQGNYVFGSGPDDWSLIGL